MNPILIIGFGYVGRRLAARERRDGKTVYALIRSDAARDAANALDVHAIDGDLDEPRIAASLPTKNAIIYYFAPPPQEGDSDSRMGHFLASIEVGSEPAAIVYISTTGVYGDSRGQWVTEESPTQPTQGRSLRRLDAERQLLAWNRSHTATRCVILRVGGIYGPNRLPLERLRRGEPMVDDPRHPSYVNVIHADDLVEICRAAGEHADASDIFNVCDGTPRSMMDYFRHIARYAGLPPPPAITMTDAEQRLSPGMLSYVKESRRIRNDRLLTKLGIRLRYADLDKGIAHSLSESN